MSFFDKFFSHKNKGSKTENELKTASEPLRSSNLFIPREQIRFILFRECDRRGRKLLFDSNTVEKVPLPSIGIMCKQKCKQENSERIIDFIETTSTHGYKYKKPSSDVSNLGEMIFGSVAIVYKGESSCKIHSIPSPKRIMFTTIVHAPSRCGFSSTSECSLEESLMGNSLASLNEITSQKETSSSDSKLYRREGAAKKCSSTYPWLKHNSPLNKITQCCEISDMDSIVMTNSLRRNSKVECLTGLCLNNRMNALTSCNLHKKEKCCEEVYAEESDVSSGRSNFNFPQKKFDCEEDLTGNVEKLTVNSNSSNESDNVSSVSGSLSSLRRRWAQYYSTSLDSTSYEDINNSPSKKRAKLGMALVLDLSSTSANEIEKFLYNHTIVIDCIMSKLQSSVELAYVKNENFVDLIHTAFLHCQRSVHDLITGGKYSSPIWITLIGDPDNEMESPTSEESFEESSKAMQNRDASNCLKLKFLNDFCDVLVKFDTKDTNFFISTLLTAVLTHHLSWVTAIAETDISARHQKLQSVIKKLRPYNPLWAQLNDLCGLLGSPLKCARTVITGSESKKSHLTTIIQVLTYFIRCYNVVENVYDVDIGDVINNSNLKTNMNCEESLFSDVVESGMQSSSTQEGLPCSGSETEKSSDDEQDTRKVNKKIRFRKDNLLGNCKVGGGGGLRRNKSCLTHLKVGKEVKTRKLYPDLNDLARKENINIADLDNYDRTIFVEEFLSNERLKEKIQRMIRIPKETVQCHLEEYLSPDEGYDTIDSTKTDDTFRDKILMERQSASVEHKDNIVFLLGEDEELVNLQKKVVLTKSSVINLEEENSIDVIVECGDSRSNVPCVSESKTADDIRTLRCVRNSNERTLWSSYSDVKNVELSSNAINRGLTCKLPWLIRELHMPRTTKPSETRKLDVSSVLGGVNQYYNSEQVIQGVLDSKTHWEHALQKDLFLCAHNSIVEKDVNEALCILGDVDSWEVSVYSSNTSILDRNKHSGVRVGMSQLVADMLESFVYLRKINLSPNFCFQHFERKLHEIYLKSKTVAELLNSTELCTMDYLTKKLDIEINDVPLLLSVATTHSPHISDKYGISFA